MTAYTLEALWIYPVKSFGGMAVEEVAITPEGAFAGDREWIVTRPDGQMVWQGDIPRMTLMAARIDATHLHVTAPDGTSMTLPRAAEGPQVVAKQYGHHFDGTDLGDEVAGWLGHHLGEEVRLIHIGAAAHRWPEVNLIHVVSLNALGVLNDTLSAKGLPPTEVERFRPNVVLGGGHAPFAEETAGTIPLDSFALEVVVSSGRCELVNIRRDTAAREAQPLKAIGGLAKSRPASLPAGFGVYAKALGTIARK